MLKHKENPPLAMTAEVKESRRYHRSLQKKTQVTNTAADYISIYHFRFSTASEQAKLVKTVKVQ